jgi:hypothetical protein
LGSAASSQADPDGSRKAPFADPVRPVKAVATQTDTADRYGQQSPGMTKKDLVRPEDMRHAQKGTVWPETHQKALRVTEAPPQPGSQ